MLLWFVGFAVVGVWYVFRDPRFDVRFLVIGVLLPDVVDAPFGGARAMHSLTVSVAVLLAVVLLTVGRRAARKRWLALPIGMFFHLVADGAFALTQTFWWPFGGWTFPDEPLPSVARGWWNVPLELAGLAAIVWAWKRFDLSDPEHRRRVVREGTLPMPHELA